MKNGINLWLDDCRPMPAGYDLHVYTAQAAIAALETGTVEKISLDHDLGPEWETGNGYMVAKWIEEAAYLNKIPKLVWYIHSQNSVGVASMKAALTNADRYWEGA
jgi:hypothetical protein